MRSDSARHRQGLACWAAGYPSPSDPYPIYMFGTFPGGLPDAMAIDQADKARLGIREAAGPGLPDAHPDRHADVRADDGHRFIFGVAAEQSLEVPPQAPAFCFWGVGAA